MPYRRGEAPGTWQMGVFDAEAGSSTKPWPPPPPERQAEPARLPRRLAPASGASRHGDLPRTAARAFRSLPLESLARLVREAPPGAAGGLEPPGRPGGSPPKAFQRPAGEARLTGWQRESWRGRGDKPPILVEAPTRFEQLIIPELGYRFQLSFHPEQAEALAAVPHRPTPGQQLWLSRSKLPAACRTCRCRGRGPPRGLRMDHRHPEASPSASRSHAGDAERVAGEQGSALHSILFPEGSAGAAGRHLPRRPRARQAPARQELNLISASTKGSTSECTNGLRGRHPPPQGIPGREVLDRHRRVLRKARPDRKGRHAASATPPTRAPRPPPVPRAARGRPNRPKGRTTATRINRLAAIVGRRALPRGRGLGRRHLPQRRDRAQARGRPGVPLRHPAARDRARSASSR